MFAGKKSAQIREILISESAWEEMTCLFAPSLESDHGTVNIQFVQKIFLCYHQVGAKIHHEKSILLLVRIFLLPCTAPFVSENPLE